MMCMYACIRTMREGAPANVIITNSATIVFDTNEPIETDPAWWNTVGQVQTIVINGGEGDAITNIDLFIGAPYGDSLPKAPVKDKHGYTFAGWFSGPNGTGRQITPESLVEAGDNGIYADWRVNTYFVVYNANGGEGEMSPQTNTYDLVSCLTSNTFTRTFHRFLGWSTNETGEAVYEDGAVVSNLTAVANGVVDLFAVWQCTANVMLEIDGVETNLTLIVGEPFGELPDPGTRDGYTFGGWYTQPEGQGMRITPTAIVPEGLTGVYAYWMKNETPPPPQPAKTGPVQPWTAKKAVVLDGAVYDADGKVAGVVQLKVAKPNAKKHNAKVSGAVTLLDGKKRTLKAAAFTVPADAPISANLTVKGLGTLSLAIGDDGFEGSVGAYTVASAKVGGKWTRTDARVYVEVTGVPAGTIEDLLPDGEPVRAKGGKWAFDKAASIKYAKGVLSGDNDPKKPNRSAMKLTYTPKTGLFKGSFKLYALQGGKLKKFTVKITGVVVDGEGTGVAKLAKPAVTWSVSVR